MVAAFIRIMLVTVLAVAVQSFDETPASGQAAWPSAEILNSSSQCGVNNEDGQPDERVALFQVELNLDKRAELVALNNSPSPLACVDDGSSRTPHIDLHLLQSGLWKSVDGLHVAQSALGFQVITGSMVEVVASHFDEDLSWMSLHSSPRVQFTVYSKSPTPPVNSLPLPNVGREGHTYLHHIVKNYDNLAAWTVFTQGVHPAWGYHGAGELSGHLSDDVVFDDYLEPFPNGEDSFFVFTCISQYPSGMVLTRMGFLLHDLKSDALQKSLCPARGASGWSPWWFSDEVKARFDAVSGISNWYHKYIAQDVDNGLPLTLAFAQGARFAVSRARIHVRPRQYYETLLQQLSTSSNPIEGYWLEASWYDIFHPEKLQSMKPACAFPAPPADITSAISGMLSEPKNYYAIRAIAEKDGILKDSDAAPGKNAFL